MSKDYLKSRKKHTEKEKEEEVGEGKAKKNVYSHGKQQHTLKNTKITA